MLFTLFLVGLTLPTQVSAVPEFHRDPVYASSQQSSQPHHPGAYPGPWHLLASAAFPDDTQGLDDSARVDGAGHLRIIRHVMVPLSWPAISAVMIITGPVYLERFLSGPTCSSTSPSRMTAPLALVSVQAQQGGGPIGAVFAGLSILCVPVVIAFVIFQRRLMEGFGYRGISR